MEGRISNLQAPERNPDRPKVITYGFIEIPDLGRAFFHQNDFDTDMNWAHVGDVVEVGRVVEEDRGLRAQDVTWVRHSTVEDRLLAEETPIAIYVDRVLGERGIAFARTGDNRDVFLHVSDFADYTGENGAEPTRGESATFENLNAGDALQCVLRTTARGLRGKRIEVTS